MLLPGRHRHHGQRRPHKVDGIREAVEKAKATLVFLPPYSPDVNPIEQVFATLKTRLRKATARTIPNLWDAIGKLFNAFTPQECTNFFVNAGYASEYLGTALGIFRCYAPCAPGRYSELVP